jgi:hypothetical protein
MYYWIIYLHFKCFPLSRYPLWKLPIPSPDPCLYEGDLSSTHSFLSSLQGIPLHWGIKHSQAQGPLPTLISTTYAAWSGALSCSMCTLGLVVQSLRAPWDLGGWHCCSLNGASTPVSSFSPFSNSSIGDPMLSPMVGCEHPPLYLSGSGRASQGTAILGFHQQALPRYSFWVWPLYMDWIPRWSSLWMVFPSVSAPHFVSIFLHISILFLLLRRTEHPHLCLPSSWALCGLWIVSGVLSFGANIHLSVSACHLCSFVIGFISLRMIFSGSIHPFA